MILDRIQKANDIKEIDPEDYDALAGEIREFLVNKISRSGGHLAQISGPWSLPWRFIWWRSFRRIR